MPLSKKTLRPRLKHPRPPAAIAYPSEPHRLKLVRSRRNPGLQRPTLRTFVDTIKTFELAYDPLDQGEQQSWFEPGRKLFDHIAEVGPIELLPNYQPSANGKTVVWYRKQINIPHPKAGKHYKINFARAFYRTKVWANGQLIEDVDGQTEHISGFSSFSYVLADCFQPEGSVVLIIRVENSPDPAICRGKQWSTQYQREGIWYGQASGLWGQVTLEEVSANRLRSDITGYADPSSGLVSLQAISFITDPGHYQLEVILRNSADQEVAHYSQQLTLDPGQHTHRLNFGVPDPQPWAPATPYLYQAEVTLRSNGLQLDRVHFNLGFRSITTSGNRLWLNGQPLFLDGVLYQPYHGDSFTLSYEQLKADLEYTRRVTGANLLRIHIAGADPLPLFLADQLGLLVWVEVPSPHVSNEASRANHHRELESLLRQIDAHPCVVIVSIYNESWGCQDIGAENQDGQATRDYIQTAYKLIKRQRPDLLVVDNDGWQHVCNKGRLTATDLHSLHLYVNDLNRWQDDLEDVRELAGSDSRRFRELTGQSPAAGDPYTYQDEMPILISEWGGFGALYGGPAAQLDKFNLIRRYKTALLDNCPPLAGDCYTQLGDVEQETNGLLDKDRQRLGDSSFLNASQALLTSRPAPRTNT